MDRMRVTFAPLRQASTECSALSSNVSRISSAFINAANRIDWLVHSQARTEATARRINQNLNSCSTALGAHGRFLSDAHREYVDLDNWGLDLRGGGFIGGGGGIVGPGGLDPSPPWWRLPIIPPINRIIPLPFPFGFLPLPFPILRTLTRDLMLRQVGNASASRAVQNTSWDTIVKRSVDRAKAIIDLVKSIVGSPAAAKLKKAVSPWLIGVGGGLAVYRGLNAPAETPGGQAANVAISTVGYATGAAASIAVSAGGMALGKKIGGTIGIIAGPVGVLVGAAIGAGIGWLTTRIIQSGAGDAIAGGVRSAVAATAGAVTSVANTVANTPVGSAVIGGAQGIVRNATDKISNVHDAVTTGATFVTSTATNTLKTVGSAAVGAAKSNVNAAATKLGNVGNAVIGSKLAAASAVGGIFKR